MHWPGPLIPLANEWRREWGVRTHRIDQLEMLVRAMTWDPSVVENIECIHPVIQRWLRMPDEQRRYLESPGEGKHGL